MRQAGTRAGRRHAVRPGLALLAGGVASFAVAAHAQVVALPGTNEVLMRPRPGYDAKGLPAGPFRVFPTVDATLGYDDNVYNTNVLVIRDRVLTIAPAVAVRSDWARHSLQLDGNMRIERYGKTTIQNNEQYHLDAIGQLDVSRAIAVNATARLERQTEPRGTLGDVLIGGQPIIYRDAAAQISTTITTNRVTLRGTAGFDGYRYNDVRVGSTTFSQRYRDHDSLTLGGEVGVLVSPNVTLYGTGNFNRQRYVLPSAATQFNAQGFTLLAGVGFELTRLISARASFGYQKQTFVDRRIGAITGPAYDVTVRWNPTTLLSVALTGRRNVQQSPVIGVSGVVSSSLALHADYELLRRLLVNASIGYDTDSYRGIDRLDRRIDAQIGARYLLSRYLTVGGSYEHRRQRSDRTFGRIYDGNTLMLTLGFQA